MTCEVVIHGSGTGSRAATLVVETQGGTGILTYTRENGESVRRAFSMELAGAGRFSVLVEGRSYRVTVADRGAIAVNGRTLYMEVRDPRKLRARGAAERNAGRQTVAAAMPGQVIRVLVEVGQAVEAGQGLIVVEAMKMQNEMKSPKAGKVLEIRTAAGAAVAAGDALIVIE
ncbi:MAG TPA: biotin/lipoyl-containing protein [Bryobacteraceae bacterium]|nr:biotin/lipoyl-containing protein [Bryobacteraceae bacterium]